MSVPRHEHAATVSFATLGCKLNQFETDSIATQLEEAGFRIVPFEEQADVTVINSCTVTNRADRKSRNLWNRAARNAGLTILTGCFVDSHRDQLESDGTTWIVPNDQKQSIPALVDAHLRGEVIHPKGSVFDFPVPGRVFHTRTTIKLQDGCDNHCTFCIIPAVRGRAQSRPADQVIGAVREAVAGGSREIVLTGVNMSRYRDGETDFATLIGRTLDSVGGEWRMRISSLEPDRLRDPFVDLFNHPRMAPHLHLCLQSGSPRTLLAMRRQYTIEEYRSLAERLRAIDPLFNLTTDIIAGFPGETDADFEQSLAAIDEFGFGHVHTFPYSVRGGTRAERMPGHLPARVKTDRARQVREAAERAKRRYRERHIGREMEVLIERAGPETEEDTDRGTGGDLPPSSNAALARGLGEHYVPVRFEVPGDASDLENRLALVRITGIDSGDDPDLQGELVDLR